MCIHDFRGARRGRGGAHLGSTAQRGEGGTEGGIFFTSISGIKRTGDLFFFNPWSGVAKSDFPDFEFVIILRHSGSLLLFHW